MSRYSAFQGISIECCDHIAIVTMEQPDTRNVISDDPLMTDLTHACHMLDNDSDVGVVVITGRGSAFSAGGNIDKMFRKEGMFAGSTYSIAHEYRVGVQSLIKAVHGLTKVSIAAINGPAIGAGLDLALACDLRIASDTAKMGATFINLGLIPGDGGSWLLPRAVGHQRAAELIFTGRIVDVHEAVTLGMILSVHSSAGLMDAAKDLARTIAAKPRLALCYTKELLRYTASDLDDVMAKAAPLQAILHGSDEHHDAMQTLLSKKSRP